MERSYVLQTLLPVLVLSVCISAQELPTGVTLTPFYNFEQVDFAADEVYTIGTWEVPGLPQHFLVLDQLGFIYTLYPDTTKVYAEGELKDYTKTLLVDIQDRVHQHLRSEYGAKFNIN